MDILLRKQIEEKLKAGERLTVMSVQQELHTTELRVFISRIRRQGISVASCWKNHNGKRFKEYFLIAA